jgi:hypothetical protein
VQEHAQKTAFVLQEAEKQQNRVIASISQDGLGTDGERKAKRHQAQASRVASAKPILEQFAQDPKAFKVKAKAMLNGYAQKVQGEVAEHAHKSAGGLWSGTVELDQPAREIVRATSNTAGKKAALRAAAFDVLKQLARDVRL